MACRIRIERRGRSRFLRGLSEWVCIFRYSEPHCIDNRVRAWPVLVKGGYLAPSTGLFLTDCRAVIHAPATQLPSELSLP